MNPIRLLLALLLLSPFLVAKEVGKLKVQKVKVSCDGNMEVGTKSQRASFTGNVQVHLDDMVLQCEHLVITYEQSEEKTEIRTMKAWGGVTCHQPSRHIRAKGDRLDYDHRQRELVFSSEGMTEVYQKENLMTAKVIRVNLETGDAVAEGGGKILLDLDKL